MKRFLGLTAFVAVIGLLLFAQGCKSTKPGVPSYMYDDLRAKHADLQMKVAELEALKGELERATAEARTSATAKTSIFTEAIVADTSKKLV